MVAAPDKRRISLFGATGSIGASTIDLIKSAPDEFAVEVVTADRNVKALANIARQVGAKAAVVADPTGYPELMAALAGTGIEVSAGPEALIEAADRPVDLTVAGIVGAAGLAPALAAIDAGSDIVLANKECLVCAGEFFMDAVRRNGVRLLPADSEHNAVFQALGGLDAGDVAKVVLTASGGPFRTWTRAEMASATPEQAADHPNWSMGRKISVDSSTLMNKGLEVIEAHHLFALDPAHIEVLVHPQSIVHGLVFHADGAVLAQLSVADMRVPLANCLWWPERRASSVPPLDLASLATLDFEAPDLSRFPALQFARSALEAGGWATNILNAANEVAVGAFLRSEIGFLDIAEVVADVIDSAAGLTLPAAARSVEEALEIDGLGRTLARQRIEGPGGRGARVEMR